MDGLIKKNSPSSNFPPRLASRACTCRKFVLLCLPTTPCNAARYAHALDNMQIAASSVPRKKHRSPSLDKHTPRHTHYLRLAPLNLLASSSSSENREPGEKGDDRDRLGGRSPLSFKMASNVAQPGVLSSWKPSERSCVRATRQRRASSSCGWEESSFSRW